MADRRQRLHELVLVFMARQDELELLREEGGCWARTRRRGPAIPGSSQRKHCKPSLT
jgi:hypothetical protein